MQQRNTICCQFADRRAKNSRLCCGLNIDQQVALEPCYEKNHLKNAMVTGLRQSSPCQIQKQPITIKVIMPNAVLIFTTIAN